MKKFISLFCLLVLLPVLANATTTSTTLSSAVDSSQEYVVVASATGVTAPGRNNAVATVLFVDREAMEVTAVSGTRVSVKRGSYGTPVMTHYSAATVWVAGPQDYKYSDPFGPCVSANERTLPAIVITTGNVFDCTGTPAYWVPIGWGGTSGSSVTGTGAYVLTTSPTLTSASVTTDIRATTAGAGTVGTAAKPFLSLVLGTAATNVFTFTPAAAGAARTITIADPGGAATLAYTNSTSAQTITTTTKFGDSSAPTKALAISLSGATAGQTTTLTFAQTGARAITFPDATDTLVGKATTDTLTNKTLTGAIITDTVKCATQFDAVTGTTGTTLTNVDGMVVTVVPGTYRFYLNVPGVTTANAGVKYAFKYTGTAVTSIESTSRNFTASGVAVQHVTDNSDQALLTDSAGGGGGPVVISTVIEGTMVVGTGGTIQFQAAQKAAHADTVSVYVGASMTFTRIS